MLCDEEYCGIGDVVKGNAPLREARNGARGRNRTTDTMIFSHVLYQLSYPGVAAAAVRGDRRAVGCGPMAKGRRIGNPPIAEILQSSSEPSGKDDGPGRA